MRAARARRVTPRGTAGPARRTLALVALLAVVSGACAGEVATPAVTVTVTVTVPPDSGLGPIGGDPITFWSTETQPERMAVTNRIVDAFTRETGIDVVRVFVSEDDLPETIEAAAADGILPEVIFHPIDYSIGWARSGYLDVEAAGDVVDALGRETFSSGALDLVAVGGSTAAVPSDGWGQLLVYRRDLFEQHGLAVPDDYEAIEAAASALTDRGASTAGIALATDPDGVFTQQAFEHIALANDCHLVDVAGNVQIDSANCVESIDLYARLASQYGSTGVVDAASARAEYFSGRAAMVLWSPFILDELAGLRDDALPDCPECVDAPGFLAGNSGFVTAIGGVHGGSAQYGQVSCMGIGAGSNVEAARAFLLYWFNEGYLPWLSTSVEGKFPMRRGTPEQPDRFVEGWKELETGVDRTARLGDLYGEATMDLLVAGTTDFDRWGFAQGHGDLVAAVYAALIVPRAIAAVLDGELTPEEAADQMQREVEIEKRRVGLP